MKNRIKWIGTFLSVLTLLVVLTVACSKDIQNFVTIRYLNLKTTDKLEVKKNTSYMDWIIQKKTYNQFVKILNDHPQVVTLIERDVFGSVDDNLITKLAYSIRKEKLNTKILLKR
ncbi:hypothetical protein [Psychrilyobacter atlanticus]|uniref:hypothetical protein n=1 Tax=Psychrilyobacter atlanticus TaxID=271091 RepID=UPI00041C41F3|nr:hypothetical protein [Psychrilyobacter atlanticus]